MAPGVCSLFRNHNPTDANRVQPLTTLHPSYVIYTSRFYSDSRRRSLSNTPI